MVAGLSGAHTNPMAHIDECVPGRTVRVHSSGVSRVNGRTGVIIEVHRTKRLPTDPLTDHVTVDIPKHGPVVVTPTDIDVVAS
jgi:hypothetical protein